MKTMSSRVDTIHHSILTAFGIVGARSVVNTASVYHSASEFDKQASLTSLLGIKYRQTMLSVLDVITDACAALHIPATLAHLLAGHNKAQTLAAHRKPIKLESAISIESARAYFDAKYIYPNPKISSYPISG